MTSKATQRLWKHFDALPLEVQEQARRAIEVWLDRPYHPGGGVHVSQDGGQTWIEEAFSDTSVSIFHVTDDGGVYGVAGGYAVRTIENGEKWDRIPFSSRYAVNHGAINTGRRLWFAAGDELYATDAAWSGVNLVNKFTRPVSRIFFDSAGRLYITIGRSNEGVDILRSDDEGANWSSIALPVDNCSRCRLAETERGFLLLGTSSGVFRSSAPVVTYVIPEREFASSSVTLDVFPNPMSKRGRVSFSIPWTAGVSVEIYNILGRLVMDVGSAIRPAGTHELAFETGDLAPGIYVCRLGSGDVGRSRIFVVSR